MSLQSYSAFDDWMSLYSEEVEIIWKSEDEELRRIAMLILALNQEFKRTENHLNSKLQDLKNQINEKENLNIGISNISSPTSSDKATPNEEMIINRSPKLNKRRKRLQLKKQSERKTSQEKSTLNVPPSTLKSKLREELFNSNLTSISIEDTDSDNDTSDCGFNSKLKKLKSDNIVESSFIVQQTPCKPVQKKTLLETLLASNATTTETSNKVKEKPKTLVQYFALDIKSKNNQIPSTAQKNQTKPILSLKKEEQNGEEKKAPKKTEKNYQVPLSFLRDYDKIPSSKDKQPQHQHVHKTETVRCKADRMKLPGWSCNECKLYYEGANLTPEELRKKMDACSKHRNRFPPSNETIAGFWDVGMPDTQETIDDITMID